jgi:hypothetical protein
VASPSSLPGGILVIDILGGGVVIIGGIVIIDLLGGVIIDIPVGGVAIIGGIGRAGRCILHPRRRKLSRIRTPGSSVAQLRHIYRNLPA